MNPGKPYLILEYDHSLFQAVAREARHHRLSEHISPPETKCEAFARGDARTYHTLRTLSNVYEYHWFDVSSPRGLGGKKHLSQLGTHLRKLAAIAPKHFRSFRIEAAGKQSRVFKELAHKLSQETQLRFEEEGAFVLRVRPARYQARGWEVLIRTTPRPLSQRQWRTENYPGSLNGPLASAIHLLSGISGKDEVLDLMCGAGTFLIERAHLGTARKMVGIDKNDDAIRIATRQARTLPIEFSHADACATPFQCQSFNRIVCNPPWGERHGSRSHNRSLYHSLLPEITRLLKPDGRAAILTQDVSSLESTLDADTLKVVQKEKVVQRGYTPYLYLLKP